MDGTVHPLSERLNDHVNGRCVAAPIVKGATLPKRQTGAEWFAEQDEATQRRVLGNNGYEVWRAGAVDLHDFVGQKRSAAWGTTRYARSATEVMNGVVARIRAVMAVPRPEYHLRRHAAELDVSTVEQYTERVKQHVARPGLSYYVTRRRDGNAMWYAIDLESREVLLYNQSGVLAWSFYVGEPGGVPGAGPCSSCERRAAVG